MEEGWAGLDCVSGVQQLPRSEKHWHHARDVSHRELEFAGEAEDEWSCSELHTVGWFARGAVTCGPAAVPHRLWCKPEEHRCSAFATARGPCCESRDDCHARSESACRPEARGDDRRRSRCPIRTRRTSTDRRPDGGCPVRPRNHRV